MDDGKISIEIHCGRVFQNKRNIGSLGRENKIQRDTFRQIDVSLSDRALLEGLVVEELVFNVI